MTKHIAIIGAGISGLSLAYLLKSDANITVFEKSRGVGGRMSTRYTDAFEFDHAAQYFTVRSNEFKQFLAPFIEQDVVSEWQPRILTVSKEEKPKNDTWSEPHYTANPRMNSLCKALADGVEVRSGTEISSLLENNGKWTLTTTKEEIFDGFDWVICSAPSPQAQKILPIHFKDHEMIQRARMVGCMSLMLGISDDCLLLFDAANVKNSPIEWVAVNSAKPKRSKEGSLLIQTTAEWAEKHMEENLEELKQLLIKEAVELLPIKHSDILHSALHRWRYADVATAIEKDYLIDSKHKLAACGDWCLGGRVENAFLSGFRLAQQIKKELKA